MTINFGGGSQGGWLSVVDHYDGIRIAIYGEVMDLNTLNELIAAAKAARAVILSRTATTGG